MDQPMEEAKTSKQDWLEEIDLTGDEGVIKRIYKLGEDMAPEDG